METLECMVCTAIQLQDDFYPERDQSIICHRSLFILENEVQKCFCTYCINKCNFLVLFNSFKFLTPIIPIHLKVWRLMVSVSRWGYCDIWQMILITRKQTSDMKAPGGCRCAVPPRFILPHICYVLVRDVCLLSSSTDCGRPSGRKVSFDIYTPANTTPLIIHSSIPFHLWRAYIIGITDQRRRLFLHQKRTMHTISSTILP